MGEPPLDHVELKSLLDTAISAARAPAAQILIRFRQVGLAVEGKPDGTPVTIADREAESTIRGLLKAHQTIGPIDILGEEQGSEGEGSRLRWLVDPIDGTRSFVNRIPLFGTIIALEDTLENQPLIGVIHLPVLDLTYAAARGLGSTCNNTRVWVSQETGPEKAILAVGDPAQFISARREEAYRRMQELSPYLRGYTDCFGHALVINGSVGAMMDPALHPWDILATQVLVEEAGGTMILRPSRAQRKVDALFGNTDLVGFLAKDLSF